MNEPPYKRLGRPPKNEKDRSTKMSVCLPRQDIERLWRTSDSTGVSMSALMRQAVTMLFESIDKGNLV